MSVRRRWPPAFAGRWLDHRHELAERPGDLGPAAAGARRNLRVHLGRDGFGPASRELNAIWLRPDQDPDLVSWSCARGTVPTVLVHDAELAEARAVGHNLVAVGCELVLLIFRAGGRTRAVCFYP